MTTRLKKRLVNAHNQKVSASTLDLLVGVPLLAPGSADCQVIESITRAKFHAYQAGGLSVNGDNFYAYGSDIAYNRCKIVEQAMKVRSDMVLMIDGDTSGIQRENIYTIAEDILRAGYQVVSGMYFAKQPPHLPICGNISKGSGLCEPLTDYKFNKDNLVFEVDWVGGGFLAIHTDVFRILNDITYEIFPGVKVKQSMLPFFHKQLHLNQQTGRYEEEGEDTTFCRKCLAASIPIHVDCRLSFGHRSHYDVSYQDYLRYREHIKKQIDAGISPGNLGENSFVKNEVVGNGSKPDS